MPVYDLRVASVQIEIVKRADGGGVLRCIRPDGSVVWQKQSRHAAHFALHDLTHYAVETVLGFQRGFFGLIAEGWTFDDVTGKGSRGRVPKEATEVERIVGLFDGERSVGTEWSVHEFNQDATRELKEDEIRRIRDLRTELFGKWAAVPAGQALALEFALETAVK